ncbi:MAG: hypothetical protein R2867_16210 [Caldilineaceae bacterium]
MAPLYCHRRDVGRALSPASPIANCARLVWDRVNNKLAALPGARLLALTNGGTITDRGAFSAYLSDGKTKLGELDEEFVYETRVGDTLILGSQVWRVSDLTDDKVMVVPAPGATPRMPFWRGDFPWRPYALGARVGASSPPWLSANCASSRSWGLGGLPRNYGFRHPTGDPTPALTAIKVRAEYEYSASPDADPTRAGCAPGDAQYSSLLASLMAVTQPSPQARGGGKLCPCCRGR